MSPDHEHTPQDERRIRRIREAALDETIEASFPASDPPSSLPNPDDDDAVARRDDDIGSTPSPRGRHDGR
jgi:hypothetical protein